MLVRALQIAVGGRVGIRPALQGEGVGRAAVEPYVEDVVDLLVAVGIVVAQEVTGRAVEPGVGALLGDGLADALGDVRVRQGVAGVLLDEDGQGEPQARWRLTSQSGRVSTIERMRLRP